MRIGAVVAVVIGWSAISTHARADELELRLDPSGAPMCFTSSGEKAPLARCNAWVTATYLTSRDPSGAPMCFTASGEKALLARCQVVVTASYVATLDPSGAPMCFTEAGDKAPLARCQPSTQAASQLADFSGPRASHAGPLASAAP